MFSIILLIFVTLIFSAIGVVSKLLMLIVKSIAKSSSDSKLTYFCRKLRFFHVYALVVALVLLMFGGIPLDLRYGYYYRTILGIRHADSWIPMPIRTHGADDYLKNANYWKIKALDKRFAKDDQHVWWRGTLVNGAEAKSFYIDKSQLPKDRFHVFGLKYISYEPINCDIDVASAEYFVKGDFFRQKYDANEVEECFIRDKENVYFYGKKINVDRNTFAYYTHDWYYDKNFLYLRHHNDSITIIDSLRCPAKELSHCYDYLKNGNSVIYWDSVIIKNETIKTMTNENLGLYQCKVNGRLYNSGKLAK